MKTIKFIILTLITSLTICSAVYGAEKVKMQLNYDGTAHYYENEAVYISVNGKVLNGLTMPPVIMNGYTLVPAREVFEALGANVEYDDNIGQVFIKYDGNIIIIQENSDIAYINSKKCYMETESKIINNKIMIPLRFVSDTIGFDVEWNSSTRTVSLNSPEEKNVHVIDGGYYNYEKLNDKLADDEGNILAEYPFIYDAGCNVYVFSNEEGYEGLLDQAGQVVIAPKYNNDNVPVYAVNDTITFKSGNRFDIYDTKGNLKKSIESPLGYDLAFPGYNEKFGKVYRISGISGSNVLVHEHLGDMAIGSTPEQEWFIIRLFSEKKAGEDYYAISTVPSGEFIGYDKKDKKIAVLNINGELKFKTDMAGLDYLDDGLYYGYKEWPDNSVHLEGDPLYPTLENYKNVTVLSPEGKVLADNINFDSIVLDKSKRELSGKVGEYTLTVKY